MTLGNAPDCLHVAGLGGGPATEFNRWSSIAAPEHKRTGTDATVVACAPPDRDLFIRGEQGHLIVTSPIGEQRKGEGGGGPRDAAPVQADVLRRLPHLHPSHPLRCGTGRPPLAATAFALAGVAS